LQGWDEKGCKTSFLERRQPPMARPAWRCGATRAARRCAKPAKTLEPS
jgi:hypothetical protein